MRRNCNLDLGLSPSSSLHSSYRQSSLQRHRHAKVERSSNESPENQQITIFYDGRVCVSDVTDLQAKAILMLAARETEEKFRTTGSKRSSPDNQPQPSLPPNHSLYMRRSLQTFLQKRKNRIRAASPYHLQQ